jgi:transposase
MLETGTITRFGSVGNFSSYCRCVDSRRESNGRKKGEGNAKNGNKYLDSSWLHISHRSPARSRLFRSPKSKADFPDGVVFQNSSGRTRVYAVRCHA